jgi:hypothetical protein
LMVGKGVVFYVWWMAKPGRRNTTKYIPAARLLL